MAIVSGLFRELLRQAEASRYYFDEEEPLEQAKTAAPPVFKEEEAAMSYFNEDAAAAEKTKKSPAAAAPLPDNSLFKTDAADLVRGIVMAEVLGPPVSRKRGFGPARR